MIIEDPLIQQIRAIKERLASEADFNVHTMAEIIRKKRPAWAAAFGLEIPNPEGGNRPPKQVEAKAVTASSKKTESPDSHRLP